MMKKNLPPQIQLVMRIGVAKVQQVILQLVNQMLKLTHAGEHGLDVTVFPGVIRGLGVVDGWW